MRSGKLWNYKVKYEIINNSRKHKFNLAFMPSQLSAFRTLQDTSNNALTFTFRRIQTTGGRAVSHLQIITTELFGNNLHSSVCLNSFSTHYNHSYFRFANQEFGQVQHLLEVLVKPELTAARALAIKLPICSSRIWPIFSKDRGSLRSGATALLWIFQALCCE